MTFIKRLLLVSSAFIVLVVGSLSFFPKSFAVDDYEFPFYESDIPSLSNYSYSLSWVFLGSGNRYYLRVVFADSPLSISVDNSHTYVYSQSASGAYMQWSSSSQTWSTYSTTFPASWGSPSSLGLPFPHSGSLDSNTFSGSTFHYSFLAEPFNHIPSYWDYMPFYFPEMPHGYFDGNINVVDGTYNIDFPSNSSISGTITQSGMEHYTWVWDEGSAYFYGDDIQGQIEGWIDPDYQAAAGQIPPGGDISQTAAPNKNISLSLSDLDSVVSYVPSYNENSRFRCWSCVADSSYIWFVSDTRNKITGRISQVTSDDVSWQYVFSDPEGGNTIYPTWAIVFSPMGEVVQVLSPSSVSNSNTYTITCSIGSLEQDQDTGKWSVDPLYHGLWFSQDSPSVANINYLQVAENKKYLANPVFGESAFQLQFLDSINSQLELVNSNIQSLQSAMQSSISNQTSAFQNMDAPSNFDPTSVSNMLEYGSLESTFNAPSTNDLFSLSGGSYTDGMGFWRDRMNEVLFFNGSPILPMTIFSLTLGLAVLVIGRRVSGGGTA